MKSPVPFGSSTLNNSPLYNAKPGTSDSDYPCKLRPGVYDLTAMNYMKVGEPQLLDFIGLASHGGGTCQIAVSLDKEPSANSTFKIIQVFEGGCPIDSNANDGTHPFTFVLPQGFPNGVSTLAWVWYNRIGEREIYMNCAPITVSGGSDNSSYFDSLPNLYLINLPIDECESGDGPNAVTIPHPGQFILRETAGQSLTHANGPSCSASAAAQTEGVVGYREAVITTNGAAYRAPTPNLDSTRSSSPQDTPVSVSYPGSVSGTAFPSAKTGDKTMSSTVASAAPLLTSAADHSTSTLLKTTSSSSGASSETIAPCKTTSSDRQSCDSVDEQLRCSADGIEYALCSNGLLKWQAVAPGTRCLNGKILRRT